MATITLYADRINRMPAGLRSVRTAVDAFRENVDTLRISVVAIDSSICNLDDIISSLRASSDTQEMKADTFEDIADDTEEFIETVISIDEDAAEAITTQQEDFYDTYSYLRPEESLGDAILDVVGDIVGTIAGVLEFGFEVLAFAWDAFTDALATIGEWCADHWQQIVITVVIVVGVVLAVLAVVFTGGAALVPMLTAALTWLGVSAGTAATIATVASMTVAAIAIVSAVASGAFNIADTWAPLSGNWKKAQNVLNVISTVSNLAYGAGSIYSGLKGITNQQLFDYGKTWLSSGRFRSAIWSARNYNFLPDLGVSTFWSGFGDNGGQIVQQYANDLGTTTVQDSLRYIDKLDDVLKTQAWDGPSASYALNASGDITFLYGGGYAANGANTFNNIENIILGINPNVTSISSMDAFLELTGYVARNPYEIMPVISGAGAIPQMVNNVYNFFTGND
ncbi:hypothetical protein [Ruminococcus flavefaciens]|uniref:hypothetical protein n=1 Tax=Ruminococcus flavefaciens TaxID=1265 RepID=UPI0026EB9211|nr:hypothetical protein [Ruminococcus flavefaciens]